jgi:hypothetical protein
MLRSGIFFLFEIGEYHLGTQIPNLIHFSSCTVLLNLSYEYLQLRFIGISLIITDALINFLWTSYKIRCLLGC